MTSQLGTGKLLTFFFQCTEIEPLEKKYGNFFKTDIN
jgi:hypothetical protein